MDYAIVELRGAQYFVEDNIVLKLSNVLYFAGNSLILNKILLIRFLNKVYFGQPFLVNSPVTILCLSVAFKTSKKILIFKLKSKKNYRKKFGYKELYSLYLPMFKSL